MVTAAQNNIIQCVAHQSPRSEERATHTDALVASHYITRLAKSCDGNAHANRAKETGQIEGTALWTSNKLVLSGQ